MGKYSMLWLWLAVCFGVAIQDHWPKQPFYLGFLLLGFVLCIFPYAFRLKWLFLGVFALSCGAIFCFLSTKPKPNLPQNSHCNIIFQLERKLNSNEKSKRYVVEITAISGGNKTPVFNALLNRPKNEADLRFGKQYQAQGDLELIAAPSHDFLFDYKRYMARQGVFYRLKHLELFGEKTLPITVDLWFKLQRQKYEDQLHSSPLSASTIELMKALVLGDRADLQSEISQDFIQAGLAHLLAISGGHILLIYYVALWFCRFFLRIRSSSWAIFMAIVGVWAYAALIDFGPSISRACVMLSLYFGFRIFKRKSQPLHALGLSGILLIFIDAQQVFSLGYQLSYAAVLGILLLLPIFSKLFSSRHKIIERSFFLPLKMSLAAQLSTLPLVLYYFHQYPMVSLLSNMVFLLWLEFLLMISAVYVFGYGVFVHWPMGSKIIDFLYQITKQGISALAQYPGQLLQNISCSLPEALLMFLAMFLAYCYWQHKNLIWIFRSLAAMLSLFFVDLYLDYQNEKVSQHMAIDIQQQSVDFYRKGRQLQVVLPQGLAQKQLEAYFVQPYLWEIRAQNYQLIRSPKIQKSP